MKKVILAFSAVGLIAFTACEKRETVVASDAQTVATTEGAESYTVDSDVSTINWRGYKINENQNEEGGHNGFVKLQSGTAQVSNGVLVGGTFTTDNTTIESVDLNDAPDKKAKLDGHLHSDDFFAVEQFPTSTFTITNVEATDGDYNSNITGNLKMREAEKSISFRANVNVTGDQLTIKSEEFAINRKDFGVDFQVAQGALIADQMPIKLDVVANRGAVATHDHGVHTTEEVPAETADVIVD
ncbi:MAG: YceI family protein [Weeksellaceae bacterium]|nr:YceI family protein [Weeksellaceae bacterium]